jgi:hypothetical protein
MTNRSTPGALPAILACSMDTPLAALLAHSTDFIGVAALTP